MGAAITILLTLIQGLLPEINAGAAATSIASGVITSLESLVPVVIDQAPEFISEIQSIIANVKNSGVPLTQDQLTSLDALSAKCDAAFEAANAAAGGPADPSASDDATNAAS